MTEEEWQAATHPDPLLTFLGEKAGERKLRYFSCACCRRVEHLMSFPEFIRTVEVAERFADGYVTATELHDAKRVAESAFWTQKPDWEYFHSADAAAIEASENWPTDFRPLLESTRQTAGEARRATERDPNHREFTSMPEPQFTAFPFPSAEIADHMRRMEQWDEAERAVDAQFNAREAVVQATLLRDIFGNPFRPVTLDPAWLTSDVLALARGIYEERAFDRMPILADALQDAGCTNEEVLKHCRNTSLTHVRGCWVVDLVLGKA